jgi:hypothetical protein
MVLSTRFALIKGEKIVGKEQENRVPRILPRGGGFSPVCGPTKPISAD